MKYILLCLFAGLTLTSASAQNSFKAVVRDSETQAALPGVTAVLEGTTTGGVTNPDGQLEIQNIPDGLQVIVFQVLQYTERKITFIFPLVPNQPVEVLLRPADAENIEEVIITTTRSSRTIGNLPTRVEFIGGEELDEKSNMKPGDIRMLLNESTGIQTQQTSVASANANIRIQGLDGRYTQILKDGFPLYGGYSGGLSIMQIPPLDLKQVDIIKGSASTLYGGGAVAGLVNLISKKPTNQREISFMGDVTSALGLNLSGFYAQKFEKIGITLFAARNSNQAYDPAGIGFSAIPQFTRYTINPALYFYLHERATLKVGVNAGFEDRLGGAMDYIKGGRIPENSFFEQNETVRIGTQLDFSLLTKKDGVLNLKNSLNIFDRGIAQPNYFFGGRQLSSFSEVSYLVKRQAFDWVFGGNIWADKFEENEATAFGLRDFDQFIVGGFVQNNWDANDWLSVESGLRVDYAAMSGANNSERDDAFVLPRVALLFKINPKLTSRLGGGLGYKTPTIFTEDAETQVFRNVQPLDFDKVGPERSYGLNADANYRTGFSEDWTFSINQLFFFTHLQEPLVFDAEKLAGGIFAFENANGFTTTWGGETNIKLGYQDFKLFIGYTLVNANHHFNSNKAPVPLTARHRLNNVLVYEVEEKWRVGLEAYYFGPQTLSNGRKTRDYWVTGFMTERIWERFSLYVNFENFLDTRQTKFGSIYTGSIANPEFTEIYAPLDGFVINGGIKIRL